MGTADDAKPRKKLTLRERAFLAELFSNGLNSTQAYVVMMQKLGKQVQEKTAAEQGSRMRKRICDSAEFSEIMRERGIDLATLADDLNRLRTMKRPAFNREGQLVGEFDDGQTQLGAVKLASEGLGAMPSKLDINITGPITIGLPPEPPKPEEAPGA